MPKAKSKPVRPKTTLNHRQELFAIEYAKDGNGMQAAIRAGYSENGADVHAFHLLRNPKIAAKIRAIKDKWMERREISAERVIGEIADIAFSDLSDAFDEEGRLLPLRKMPARMRRAIAGIDVEELYEYERGSRTQIGTLKKIRLWPKLGAIEMLAKKFGIVSDGSLRATATLTGKDGNKIELTLDMVREIIDSGENQE